MALLVNYQIEYGSIKVKSAADEKKLVTVKFHPANCDCGAFIYHYTNEKGEKMAQLWNFLSDREHIANIMRNSSDHTLLGTSVVSVRLNVYYKQARMIVEACAKSGYKVECYYKEPKENQKE